jgi:hypothetical protein
MNLTTQKNELEITKVDIQNITKKLDIIRNY